MMNPFVLFSVMILPLLAVSFQAQAQTPSSLTLAVGALSTLSSTNNSYQFADYDFQVSEATVTGSSTPYQFNADSYAYYDYSYESSCAHSGRVVCTPTIVVSTVSISGTPAASQSLSALPSEVITTFAFSGADAAGLNLGVNYISSDTNVTYQLDLIDTTTNTTQVLTNGSTVTLTSDSYSLEYISSVPFTTAAIQLLPVTAVPLPGSIWFLGSGLLALCAAARKKL